MLITNHRENVRYLFYTVGGGAKSVKFEPLETKEIADLTSTAQTIYNSLDYKLLGINQRLGTNFEVDFISATTDIFISSGTLGLESTATGDTSDSQNYIVSGTNLTNNIIITAPTYFIINLDDSMDNDSPITLTHVGGTITDTYIYVKFVPTYPGEFLGVITHTSIGTTTESISISGDSYVPSPTILGAQVYYELENNVLDSTENGNDGTPTDITYVSGKTTGFAASFNGTTTKVVIKSGKLSNTNTGTGAVWIYPTSFSAGGNAIWNYGGTDLNSVLQFEIFESGAAHYLVVVFRTEAGTLLSAFRGSTDIQLNTWALVELYTTGTAWVIKYNNVAETLVSIVGDNQGRWFDDLNATNGESTFGVAFTNGTYSRFFQGYLDKFVYWDRVIADYENANMYNLGNQNQWPPLPDSVVASETRIFEATGFIPLWGAGMSPIWVPAINKYLHNINKATSNLGDSDINNYDAHYYTSDDLTNLTHYSEQLTAVGRQADYTSGSFIKANGDIFTLYLNVLSFGLSKLTYRISTDNGLTRGAEVTLRSNSNEYVVIGSTCEFKSPTTNRRFLAYALATDRTQPASTDYTTCIIYTDDEYATFTDLGSVMTSPDGVAGEPGLTELADGTLMCFTRGRIGFPQYCFNSTDNGETWGAAYASGLPTQIVQPNFINIYKLSTGKYFAGYNYINRRTLQYALSDTALPNTWTYFYVSTSVGFGEQILSPYLVEFDGWLYLYYNKSRATATLWDLWVQKIKIITFP